MSSVIQPNNYKRKLHSRYIQLMEQAYNLRQSDSALSDIIEFRAIKILDKLNKLNFLNRDTKTAPKV